MKKVLPLVLTLLIFLTGCAKQQAQTEATKQSDIVKTKKMEKRAQQKKAYQATLQSAQKEGTEQKKFLKSVAKAYTGGAGELGMAAFTPPDKLSEFGTNKFGEGSQAVVVTGVVTKWVAAPRSEVTGEVMTDVILAVDRQLTYEKEANLVGKPITIRCPGGYTTVGEQMNSVPNKAFAPKPVLTEEEKQDIVFVDNTEVPLPRIGDQILIAVSPFDSDKKSLFFEKGQFSATDIFNIATGDNGLFYFNADKGVYESKNLDPITDSVVTNPIENSNEPGTIVKKKLLEDINANYLKD